MEKVEISITPIGVMRCGLRSTEETPAFYDESTETGVLEILAPYQEAMTGIEVGQKIMVLFWLHQARRDLLKVYPRGDRSRGLRGVFTTRSPMRPNPIALSELTVIGTGEGRIEVSGIDVIDGTPILDIKSAAKHKTGQDRG
jgi:L-fuculose-phosphate aldolase